MHCFSCPTNLSQNPPYQGASLRLNSHFKIQKLTYFWVISAANTLPLSHNILAAQPLFEMNSFELLIKVYTEPSGITSSITPRVVVYV